MGIIPVTSVTSVQVNIFTQIRPCLMNFVRFTLIMQEDAATVIKWPCRGSVVVTTLNILLVARGEGCRVQTRERPLLLVEGRRGTCVGRSRT